MCQERCRHSQLLGAADEATPIGLELSADGRALYAAASVSNAVAVFDRDPTSGVLTQKAGTAGRIANVGTATCADGRALNSPNFFWRSPDGAHLYVASQGSGSVTALAIAGNGTLSQVADGPGGSGCVQNVPSAEGCADGRAMGGPFAITADSERRDHLRRGVL